ncbi:hypothetical protein NCS56_00320200 [Fusarium sp. Ph1]|nr:hypothetical protein NCS56_00320200 [Fusarium sp. Ph1]
MAFCPPCNLFAALGQHDCTIPGSSSGSPITASLPTPSLSLVRDHPLVLLERRCETWMIGSDGADAVSLRPWCSSGFGPTTDGYVGLCKKFQGRRAVIGAGQGVSCPCHEPTEPAQITNMVSGSDTICSLELTRTQTANQARPGSFPGLFTYLI